MAGYAGAAYRAQGEISRVERERVVEWQRMVCPALLPLQPPYLIDELLRVFSVLFLLTPKPNYVPGCGTVFG